jgi:phosphoserine phosphatase
MPLLSLSLSTKAFLLFPRMSHTATKTRLRGVVFDMDGTLTVPVIDFVSMYKAVLGENEYQRIKASNPVGIDILKLIDHWSPHQQRQAYDTIAQFEQQALQRLQIMPGSNFFFSSFGFVLSQLIDLSVK